MPFPESQRVVYAKNPLDRVICQFRFPPILRIDSEPPVAFQERLRRDYPELKESSEFEFEVAIPAGGRFTPDFVPHPVRARSTMNYEFASEDGKWQLNLARTFISVTTTDYTRWEDFQVRLSAALGVLTDVYAPPKFVRTGLRYVDIFKRSVLGLEQIEWKELLAPQLIGVLGSEITAPAVKGIELKQELLLDDVGGVARVVSRTVKAPDSGEQCIVIDSDFFTNSHVPIDDAMAVSNQLHEYASRLIRWAISDTLHDALQPTPL